MSKFLNFDGEARIENNGLNLFSENVYYKFKDCGKRPLVFGYDSGCKIYSLKEAACLSGIKTQKI